MTEPLFAFEPLKTKNCYAEDMLKMSSRHVFKTSSRPTNIWWVCACKFLEGRLRYG